MYLWWKNYSIAILEQNYKVQVNAIHQIAYKPDSTIEKGHNVLVQVRCNFYFWPAVCAQSFRLIQ